MDDHTDGDAIPVRAWSTSTAQIGDRTVVFDRQRRQLFELRTDIALLWHLFDGFVSIGELQADSPSESAAIHLDACIRDLVAQGLLVLRQSNGPDR